MKKKQLAAFIMVAALGLGGCGQTAEPAAEKETNGWEMLESAGQTEVTEKEENGDMETPDAATAETEENGETEESGDNGISITAQHFEGTSDPADTTVNYTYSYDLPQVTIAGNETAQDAIQEDLQAYVDTFLAGLQENEFGAVYEDEESAMGCYQNLSMTVLRADDKVISIQMSNEGYGGGAHGWYTLAYFNYFPQTGERMTFDKLGEGFREKAEELVTKKAAELQQTENCFYEDYESSIPLVVLDGTENSSDVYKRVYGDDVETGESTQMDASFYVTDTGFTFVSGQYVLQPYAGGVVELEIPAADFGAACRSDLWN